MAERKRNYQKEYRDFHGKPEQRKRRSNRNKARRKMGQPNGNVHHKDGNPNNNARSNLEVRSAKDQRKEGGRKTSGNRKK